MATADMLMAQWSTNVAISLKSATVGAHEYIKIYQDFGH